jgi:hypothetical protein
MKHLLLEYILAGPISTPLQDPDQKLIRQLGKAHCEEPAAYRLSQDEWVWKGHGVPRKEGNNVRGQRTYKSHTSNVLAVNRFFYREGIKILLREQAAVFTFSVGSRSGNRFLHHLRWSSGLDTSRNRDYLVAFQGSGKRSHVGLGNSWRRLEKVGRKTDALNIQGLLLTLSRG